MKWTYVRITDGRSIQELGIVSKTYMNGKPFKGWTRIPARFKFDWGDTEAMHWLKKYKRGMKYWFVIGTYD